MANIERKFFKVGTDVLEGTDPSNIRKLELPEFKSLGLNFELLGQGVGQGQTLEQMGVRPLVAPIKSTPSVPEEKSPELPFDTDTKGGVTDTSEDRAAEKRAGADVFNQIQGFLSKAGLEKPDTGVGDAQQQILKSMEERQKVLDKREQEDLARVEAEFGAAAEQLTESQRLEKERAEGQVFYKGYIFRSETDDLRRLDQAHRTEMNNLLQQKQTTIQQAQRFYEDKDFNNAELLLQNAKAIEQQEYQKSQDYLTNFMRTFDFYQKLQEPIISATEADQNYAMSLLEADPSIGQRLGIKPSDIYFGNVNTGEIIAAYLDGEVFSLQQRGKEAEITRVEQLAGLRGQPTPISPTGQPIPTGTSSQFVAANYASRIQQANQIFNDLENQIEQLGGFRLGLESILPGFLKSDVVRQKEQAERNFVNAVLRRESGAAIAESEFESAKKQYFIQPGDDEGTLVQKKLNRQLVERNFIYEGGSAFVPPQLSPLPQQEGLSNDEAYQRYLQLIGQ